MAAPVEDVARVVLVLHAEWLVAQFAMLQNRPVRMGTLVTP